MSDEAEKTRQRWGQLLSIPKPEISAAQYWEAQAEMWHENYKSVLAIEEEHRRFKEALDRIAVGTFTGPRCQAIAKHALRGKND